MKNLTVICVFWEGRFRNRPYTPEWVQKLQNMVKRNLSLPHRFVCLTNVEEIPGVETIQLNMNLPGWWAKMELFREDIPGERFLYLDLDLLVLKDLDSFVNYDSEFAILKAFGTASGQSGTVHGYNSSVMVWDKERGLDLFYINRELLGGTKGDLLSKFRGDQDYIAYCFPNATTFPKDWVTKIRYCSTHDICNPDKGVKILLCMPDKNNVAVKKFPWMKEIWK